MIFNGTSQGAYRESGIEVDTAVWAVGAWVKRTDFSDLGTVLGAIRPTGFRRESSCVVRDSGGIVASSCYSDGSDVLSGTVAFPADEWILILRIKPSASGGDWVTIVGDNTLNTNNPYIGTPTRFSWAHSRASDVNNRFTPMKAAHLMVWTDTIPDEDSITQLRAGMIPSEIDVPPTIYEPAISSVSGAITTFGTPTFDSDDPLAVDPAINPTGTTTSAAPGATCTAVISNRGSLTVTGVAIYDPVSEISTAQTGVSLDTETDTVSYTRTRGNLPYKSGLQLRITMSDASVLTIDVEMTIEDDWQFVVLANPLADSENSVLHAYTDESSGDAEAGMQLYGPLTVPVGGGFWSVALLESGVANFQWVWEGDEGDDPGPPISVTPTLALWNGVSWVSFAPTLYNTPPDDYPDVLTFVSVFNAEYDQEYESNDVAITGINTEAEVIITGGAYRLDGGAPTDESGPAVNNQQLRLVGVAPGGDDQVTTVSGTVGSRPFIWRIYTPMTAAPTPFEPRMTVVTMDVMTMDVISMEAM